MGKTIHQKIHFKASPHEIYEMLMDSEKHAAFSGAPAEISREAGGKFTCYGEYIRGENVELEADKKIVQKWIGKDFPEGEVSKVTFELKEREDGGTDLELTHEDVPDEIAEHIEKGWHDHYWDKMKKSLDE